MAIFGRWSARQRLRRATRESLTIPTFSSSLDCTTRVIGGLWPAELSSNTAETATLAEHLKADLHRIVGSANDELMVIWRAGMADSTRRAEEDRVIDRARASAMRRVESAMRELRQITGRVPVEIPRMRGAGGSDLDTTRLMPAVTVVQPADQACTDWPVAAAEDDEARLQRLLAFVARQEPRLNWAVGVHADGTTVLVTDVAMVGYLRASPFPKACDCWHRRDAPAEPPSWSVSRRVARRTPPVTRCVGRSIQPRRRPRCSRERCQRSPA